MPSNKAVDSFEIDGVSIGKGSPVYFIADIAANHDGDLNRAIELIYKAAKAGANAAKFQHFDAKSIVSDIGFKSLGGQFSHQSRWKKSVFQTYKDASLDLSWTPHLKSACEDAGITFFTSPYDFSLVDVIDEFVPAFKIGSGDITWLEIIQHIAKKNKPYIIASGASNFDEVERAINVGLNINKNIALLQCNTNYTASLENYKYIQLNVLKLYRKWYPTMILGLSDHTLGHSTVLGAIALDAKIIEKHFTDDVSRDGPDHAFSMNPQSWAEMVLRARELELSLGDAEKKIELNELETAVLQRRAIRTIKFLPKGSVLKRSDLEVLRPCPKDSISAADIDSILGKRLRYDLKEGEAIKWSGIELQ